MTDLSRRGFLGSSLGVACCAAASPLLTPVTVAAAPGENRLVTIILRGGMDAVGVFAPYRERRFRELRPNIAKGDPKKGYIDLDGRFGMDARLAPLAPFWKRGELAVAHAVSTPYRDKRSHFDGQDLLEAGVTGVRDVDDGWLNRALPLIGGRAAETAISVGRDDMLLMRGDAPVRSWVPGYRHPLHNDERELLQMLYAKDRLFAEAAEMAGELTRLGGGETAKGRAARAAQYAADRLSAEARIAAFSIGGWDSHASQPSALKRPLETLAQALTILRNGLGPAWGSTLVIAMTEFGRTARENGNRGTDHGTGGAALLAGGALSKAAVLGKWPGLADGDLYQGRDLMPTMDVRHYPAWALRAMFGVEKTALERSIFPGLDMGPAQKFIA